MMKKLILVGGLIVSFCSFGLANSVPVCTMSTLNNYVGMSSTGCSVGSLVFSGFTFSGSGQGSGAIVPVASGIDVTPTTTGTNSFGFLFNAALTPGSGQAQDVAINYQVTSAAGTPSITDSSFSAEASAGTGGMASESVTECIGGMLPGCSGGTTKGLNVNPSNLTASNTFAGTTMVGVGTDISANRGGTISGELAQFSVGSGGGGGHTATPEPASLLLFGTGAIGLGLLIRRKRVAQQ